MQTDRTSQVDALLGGLEMRGGTTIVIGVDGTVRYAIAKPLPGAVDKAADEAGRLRLESQARFVSAVDARDPRFPYMTDGELKQRMQQRMSIRALHGGR